MTAIPSTYRDQITMGLPTEVKAEDITLIGGLNFEKRQDCPQNRKLY